MEIRERVRVTTVRRYIRTIASPFRPGSVLRASRLGSLPRDSVYVFLSAWNFSSVPRGGYIPSRGTLAPELRRLLLLGSLERDDFRLGAVRGTSLSVPSPLRLFLHILILTDRARTPPSRYSLISYRARKLRGRVRSLSDTEILNIEINQPLR